MKVKDDFVQFGSLCVEKGESVRFWEDKLLREVPFSVMYPKLFDIVR
jgi:hypothetical protein